MGCVQILLYQQLSPDFGRGFGFDSSISDLYIQYSGLSELTCQLYLLALHWFRSFQGLTCEFWAEIEEIILARYAFRFCLSSR